MLDTEDHALAAAIAETAEAFKEIDEALASDSAGGQPCQTIKMAKAIKMTKTAQVTKAKRAMKPSLLSLVFVSFGVF